ncbi:hypothetical protein BGZ79_001144 [Entomortierella chlamydospora]|nr:hypothetical protein BGZ79_001144 [Entomortierella chlamydospora]
MSSLISNITNHSTTLTVGKSLTVASIGLFAGVALSYNSIIMPALRKISNENALPVWAHSYNIGKKLQVGFIMTSLVTGVSVYSRTENPYYLAGSLIMTSIIPYTLAFIMPVNNTLLSILDGKKSDGNIERLLTKWDQLHFGRTLMGVAAFGLVLYGELS